jgi:aldehyde:ferredoxin oxidoreductase
MAIKGGFQGKILEVDLTNGTTKAAPLPPEDVLRTYGGATGLGLYLIAQDINPTTKVDDPDCPFFLLTGPLTGVMVPNASHWVIVNIRAYPTYHVGLSHAHGYLGARLKHAGWDGIAVRGASETPVYLWIDDDNVELRDATPYWGMDTFETPRRIKLAHDDPLEISVACIGPGGENQITGGTVRSDGIYTCARGEAGNAWGSKKLKAIAVRGKGRVKVADPEELLNTHEEWNRALYAHSAPPPTQAAHSVQPSTFANIESHGRVQGKNYSDPEFQIHWSKRWGEDAPKWRVRPQGGFNCEMECHHETTVTTGPLSGTVVSGYAGEIIQQTGPNLGIDDPGVALAINGMVDGLGLDGGEVPRNIAMVMEAYNTEQLNQAQVDGLDLTWGNYEAVIELLDKTVRREGIGAILAKPPREAGKELGIEDLAVHMKGTGFNDHDMRINPAMIFQTMIAGAGPVWQTEIGLVNPPKLGAPDLGYAYLEPKDGPDGVVEPIARGQQKKLWEDTIGVCHHATKRIGGTWDPAIKAMRAAVGWDDFSREEAMVIGERLIVLQRLIALKLGYKREYDFDISPRMLEGLSSGPAKDTSVPAGPYMDQWYTEYYELLEWDPKNGVPTSHALDRLGMMDFEVGVKPE